MHMIFGVFLAAIFPTITALVGIILDRSDARELRGEIAHVRECLARLEAKSA